MSSGAAVGGNPGVRQFSDVSRPADELRAALSWVGTVGGVPATLLDLSSHASVIESGDRSSEDLDAFREEVEVAVGSAVVIFDSRRSRRSVCGDFE